LLFLFSEKFVQSLVPLPCLYFPFVPSLLLRFSQMIIESSVGIVEVAQLRNVCEFLLRHFQHRHVDSHIIGRSEPIPELVFQVLLLYVVKHFGVEGSQVTDDKPSGSKEFILYCLR